MPSSLHQAQWIVTDGLSFRIPAGRGVFPPRDIANAFFACGRDDGPGEDLLRWEPFALSDDDYDALLSWWRVAHLNAAVDRLDVSDADYSLWFTRAVGPPF